MAAIGTLLGMVSPVFAGAMLDVTGSYRIAWVILGLVAVAAVPLILLARPPGPPQPEGRPEGEPPDMPPTSLLTATILDIRMRLRRHIRQSQSSSVWPAGEIGQILIKKE
jgi:MFS family permease